jgi:hypothetical protein
MERKAVNALDFLKKFSKSAQLNPKENFVGLQLTNDRGAEMICDCGPDND